MDELSAGLIIAVGGAALFAALAFRSLMESVIKLNRELQETVRERQQDDDERETLKSRISELERELAICKEFIEQKQLMKG
jgi:Sec-independent protein translocase protein TatA